MAKATTASFDQLVLEVETNTPGTYAKLCGLVGVTISRAANIDTDEVPDCADEALPMYIEKTVRSIDVKISASGVWAQSSHETLIAWLYSGATKNIRVTHENSAVGDTEIEAGAALLVKLDNQREKGKKVTASVEIEFVGVPTRTDKA